MGDYYYSYFTHWTFVTFQARYDDIANQWPERAEIHLYKVQKIERQSLCFFCAREPGVIYKLFESGNMGPGSNWNFFCAISRPRFNVLWCARIFDVFPHACAYLTPYFLRGPNRGIGTMSQNAIFLSFRTSSWFDSCGTQRCMISDYAFPRKIAVDCWEIGRNLHSLRFDPIQDSQKNILQAIKYVL